MSNLTKVHVNLAQARAITEAQEKVRTYLKMPYAQKEREFKELGTQLTVNANRMTPQCAFDLNVKVIAIALSCCEVEFGKL